MNCFTPKKFESLTVYFSYRAEEPQSFFDPGTPEEIEFGAIEVSGVELDIELESHLIETFGEDWGEEIKELRFD